MNISDIYDFLYPIITGCAGFIKSNGSVYIDNNIVYMLSEDKCFFSIVRLPIDTGIRYINNISTFVSCKQNPNDIKIHPRFFGSNILIQDYYRLITLFNDITNNSVKEYDSEIYDIYSNIKDNNIIWTDVVNGNTMYKIYSDKSIFPINKGDSCRLNVFNNIQDQSTKYMIYNIRKKKLKCNVEIFTKQHVFTIF